ncbi:MAG TPA: hypothetical protein VH092_00040 [Urbifossiella sp.]|jgi:Tol biopolymer transport system component|nr:hypothetical protein [Urbifossiella sp.]
MHATRLVLAAAAGLALVPASPARQPAAGKAKLLLAFASFHERKLHPKVYFYEHDGVAAGQVVGSIDPVNQRSDYRPGLTADGAVCAFAAEKENETGRIHLWERAGKKLLDPPKLNDTPNGQLGAAISADGKWLAFAAWNRPGASARWQVVRYNLTKQEVAESPGLNDPAADAQAPSLSGDGRYVAFATNRRGGAGLTDIALYDTKEKADVPLPGLNSARSDVTPSLSADGNLIAFASNRLGGAGGFDTYLYDRSAKGFLPLPGLNAVGHEQTPGLSPDGRYLVFVAERAAGDGERDVYLYDRAAGKLLPTPGLNSPAEDFDPCVVVVN